MSFQIDFPAQPRFPILAPDGSAAAPSYSFGSDSDTGMYLGSGQIISFARNGSLRVSIGSDSFNIVRDAGELIFGLSGDAKLVRDGAANTLALRNSTNAQTFRVYNTYTDASNYERLVLTYAANVAYITSAAAGSGTIRDLTLESGSTQLYLATGGGPTGFVRAIRSTSGVGSPVFGVSGTFSGSAAGTQYGLTIAPTISQSSVTGYTALLVNPTETSTGSGTKLLADFQVGSASQFSVTNAGIVQALAATAIPAGGTAGSGYKFSSTTNFGVFFGSGAPSLSAAKGSLYLRSDGSGVADRMYVNTDGSTTWTAVATVA